MDSKKQTLTREIKFRGQTIGGEWVYGFYCNIQDKEHYILEPCALGLAWTEVTPETVGQYTGKKCNTTGDKIFTGDIVKDYKGDIYHIIYDEHYAAFMLRSSMIYASSKRIEGSFDKKGNIFEDAFIEPEPRGIEPPSKTRSSDSFTRRNQKEALRGIGIKK